ncbi:hypothetical protein RHSIM_Rhsim01G0118900 [Rhododendron simsii]|uniref:Pentatricopeptide repeat-containing protein n=1 Tax=Rhododendron simsii TaxID=118357 RepID=A0A834HGA4_RHOSS|nr:hypothetical protein RHSIM_Rhsim01G0118900 [Rhododendron simsii]
MSLTSERSLSMIVDINDDKQREEGLGVQEIIVIEKGNQTKSGSGTGHQWRLPAKTNPYFPTILGGNIKVGLIETNPKQMIFSKTKPFSSLSSSHRPNPPKAPSLQTLLKSGFSPTLKDFNRFLLFLSQSGKFKPLIHFFSQMSSHHIKGNAHTHSIFTRALLKDHQYGEAHNFIKTHMATSSVSRRNRLWDRLIQGLCTNKKDPEKAFLVLQDCLSVDGTLPSSFTFCILIHSFSSKGMMGSAIEVLEMMTEEKTKYPLDNFVCSSLISGFCMIGKPELAVEFFENAESSGGLQPNCVTYTALVNAYCRLGRFVELSSLVTRMEKEGINFDVVLYSSLIHGYFMEGDLLGALWKHREMVDKQINLDTVGYTILVDGFSKEVNVVKAVEFLNRMNRDGCPPNLVTYTAVMLGFCRIGKLEEAFAVLKMVEDLGIKVDEFMYATLIDGAGRIGDFDCVFSLLDDMEKKGVNLSIVTYNTVINGLCKAGRTVDADEYSKGIVGDIWTYSTLLHGYIEEENVMGMYETKRRLEAANACLDVIMCNILIKALFMMGSIEDALALYNGMPEMNLVADSVTYCTMIDGYCRVGRIGEALEIFDKFRETSVSSVACYNCIIHGLCKNGMASVALEVFIELHEKGFSSDMGINMMLIKAIFAEKSEGGVFNLIYRIENMSEIFTTICNDAICFLCKRGFFLAACDVYMLLQRKKSVVENKSYYSMMKALRGYGKSWPTRPLLNTLVKRFGIVEPRVCKIVLDYLCIKDVDNALRFLDVVKDKAFTTTFHVHVLRTLTRDGRALDAYKLIIGGELNLPTMNVVDYSKVVDSLCKGGHMDKALDLCSFAKRKGIALSIITYNSVINGLCRQGCFIEAFRLFNSLEKIDMFPSEITYATLIDSALELFFEFKRQGVLPDFLGFMYLIRGLCAKGRMEECRTILTQMLQTQSVVELLKIAETEVGTESIESFLVSLCDQGNVQEATVILNEVASMFFPAARMLDANDGSEKLTELCDGRDIVTVQSKSLFSPRESDEKFGVSNVGSLENVMKVHGNLENESLLPDFRSYYALIASLCSRGPLEATAPFGFILVERKPCRYHLQVVQAKPQHESILSFFHLSASSFKLLTFDP